ncbi:MAG: hypothetical protein HUK01_07110 [Bacteroidaceae bacterium]|nr:hypothetical protein [Bacteroidaceae bacterium]
MLPLTFNFVSVAAIGAANYLKGELYGFKPARTNPAPGWEGRQSPIKAYDVAEPMTDPAVWTDRYVLCTLTFRKANGEQLQMSDAVVSVSLRKNIVATQLTGMDGTVKEYVNADDYTVKIAVGVIATEDGVMVDKYPSEGIKELRGFFDLKEPIAVYSQFLDLFDIDRIVITGFDLTQRTESNIQPISITALSDREYNVYSTDY